MNYIKRIFLFLAINIIIISTISIIISIFHLQPYISSFGLNYQSLLLFCFIWGIGGALISLLLSKKMAIWMMRVKLISSAQNSEEQEILNMVKQLSKVANLRYVPDVGIYQSNEVNAFATGPSQKKSLIALSSGLLNRMKKDEIQAIIAHEISHIANGDMVTMTLLQGIINAFVMFLSRILAYALSSNRGRNKNFSYFSYMMFVFLFQTIFMIFGSMGIALFSRYREYKADRGGANIAGKDKMIEALTSLRVMQEIKDPIVEQKAAIQSLKISNRSKRGMLRLFATHPPLEDRIERLRNS